MKNKKKLLKYLAVVTLIVLFSPANIFAETLGSPNYKIQNPELDGGGQSSASSNYKDYDAIDSGDSAGASPNYRVNPGFILAVFPGVPGQPTLTNTGGILYNALDFVINNGGNSSDANFAIAISDDGFVTTNYVQADDTVGANPVWQTYSTWGSSTGQRITNLKSSDTYSIKVKARYGSNSETGFSLSTSASTVAPSLSMTVSGVSSGTVVAGTTTNITTTAQSVAFSNIQSGAIRIGAQTLNVSTNATGGYTVKLYQDHDLMKTNGTIIPPVSATNAVPASWPTGLTKGAFGYHTTAVSLCTGTASRFSANDTFAAATSTPSEVACKTAPVSGDTTSLVFKVEVESLQPAGDYANQISYIVTAQY